MEFFVYRVLEWRSWFFQLRTTLTHLLSLHRWKSYWTTFVLAHCSYIIHRIVTCHFKILAAFFRPAVVQFKHINGFFCLILLAKRSFARYVQSICWITQLIVFLVSIEFNLRFYFVNVLLIFFWVNWSFVIIKFLSDIVIKFVRTNQRLLQIFESRIIWEVVMMFRVFRCGLWVVRFHGVLLYLQFLHLVERCLTSVWVHATDIKWRQWVIWHEAMHAWIPIISVCRMIVFATTLLTLLRQHSTDALTTLLCVCTDTLFRRLASWNSFVTRSPGSMIHRCLVQEKWIGIVSIECRLILLSITLEYFRAVKSACN